MRHPGTAVSLFAFNKEKKKHVRKPGHESPTPLLVLKKLLYMTPLGIIHGQYVIN